MAQIKTETNFSQVFCIFKDTSNVKKIKTFETVLPGFSPNLKLPQKILKNKNK